MKKLLLFIMILYIRTLFGLSGEAILNKIDKNLYVSSMKYTGIFKIHRGDKIFIKKFKGWALGKDKAFVKFINREDYGVKYLRIKDELWIAEDEDVVKISGHLLKRSMMGSDFSFEDSMRNEKLSELYFVRLKNIENFNNKECYVLKLTARDKRAPYRLQKIWVDTQNFVPYKIEYYALSGRLLKTLIILKIKEIKNRYFPVKLKMINNLRKNYYTIFEFKDLKIDIPVPEQIFTKHNLTK